MVNESLEILETLAKMSYLIFKADLAFRNNRISKTEAVNNMEIYLKAIQELIHNYFKLK